jgi:glucose/arabinose dehydrogenase
LNGYSLDTFLSAAYLGDAAFPAIEFALMPGHPNVALVATQEGYIYRVALDQGFAPGLYGDLTGVVQYDQGEQGLLSVQFSPGFEDDCRVYVYYSTGNPDETRVARFIASPTDLHEETLEIILHVEDFAGNHNGGHIAFDSAGYLYLSTGDGGGSGDPQETGQDVDRLLGKVLRIDVSGEDGYAIPPGNPFAGGGGAPEIFAWGFRNPFRMTIDPITDEVWLGDVGQSTYEEVDHVTLGGNYGWDCREGPDPFDDDDFPNHPCEPPFVEPRAYYPRSGGRAVTGGVIYRGSAMPELYGWYIYGDFYTGKIWAVDTEGPGDPVLLLDLGGNGDPAGVASFTLAADGEVYVVNYFAGIFMLAP